MEQMTERDLPFVVAKLNYLVPGSEKPVNYMYEPPAGVPRRTGQYATFDMRVYNARPIVDDCSLDLQGCALVSHATGVRNLYDEQQILQQAYAESAELIKASTGASEVLVFDHTLRNADMVAAGKTGVDIPVQLAHNDYTFDSGPRRVRELLTAPEASERMRQRYVQVNVWRAIGKPILESPLAVCDARSISRSDFQTMEMIYPDRVGYVAVLTHNPDHQWFYFPEMQPDEALLLKGYDSREGGVARLPAHTAFEDPSSPLHAPARESIEIRAWAFFDEP